ncbi:putative LRR receptor-like serine/threonine-protein kinase [Cinnamomum micranthum f. kanehirae]|uniref:Putative LRR receptor-like serine/threonine-protein kinase n=1 Tax=Cinnamomum micranthum f. kanehirae TaxID=337451 RepID=A0A3S3MZV0_9MAGN|nr:putative LRR receptor-like serine/threonine-protein kinase [Cinnamomum micranthum f. kanehirae]
MELAWFAILVSTLALAGAVLVHGQPGFLSIDCGIAEDSYTDDNTKIFYTSDAKFIDTGTNRNISKDYISVEHLPRQYQNLRSFPEGPRNCYTLKTVIKSNRYLLRASFMYGNYDGLNKAPQFDVYVGVNSWDVHLPSTAGETARNEIIVYTTMDYISVCLANTGNGIPFISRLELRRLNNSTYEAANVFQSVRLYGRYHFRSDSSGPLFRFPDDVYDRIWYPWGENPWISINTSSPINLREDLGYQPPLPVMNTAVMPSNVSDNLSFYFPTADFVDPRLQYHLFMHFAELRQLRSNESREFNFSIDGEYVYGPFSPSNLSVTTIFTPSPLSGQNYHEIDLCKTTSSTLPPILNAVEIFILEPFSTTPTETKDATWTLCGDIYLIPRLSSHLSSVSTISLRSAPELGIRARQNTLLRNSAAPARLPSFRLGYRTSPISRFAASVKAPARMPQARLQNQPHLELRGLGESTSPNASGSVNGTSHLSARSETCSSAQYQLVRDLQLCSVSARQRPAALLSLSSAQYISARDVSNNSLTGPVPDFLTELSSLKILNLSNNQFTGSIPTILLEKSKDGSLLLSFDNNTNLVNNINQTTAGSCKKRRHPALSTQIHLSGCYVPDIAWGFMCGIAWFGQVVWNKSSC